MKPPKPKSTGRTSLEKAFDPFTAALKRGGKPATPTPAPAAPGKPGLEISPLAVPFPIIGTVGGVEIAAARAGFYKHQRDDLVVFRFARGTSCAGVFTRHKIGSAPTPSPARPGPMPPGAPPPRSPNASAVASATSCWPRPE